MLQAKQAKEIASAVNPAEEILEEIYDMIRSSAEDGEFDMRYHFCGDHSAILKSLIDHLEDNGYNTVYHATENVITISWRMA